VQREAVARREAVSALELRMASFAAAPCDSIVPDTVIINSVPVLSRVTRTDSLVTILASASHRRTSTTLRSELSCR
jgi:hypothetical protein